MHMPCTRHALTLSQAAVEEMEAALQDAKERVWAADDSLEMTQDALSRESRARRAAEGDAAAMRTERDVAVRTNPEPQPDPNPSPNPHPNPNPHSHPNPGAAGRRGGEQDGGGGAREPRGADAAQGEVPEEPAGLLRVNDMCTPVVTHNIFISTVRRVITPFAHFCLSVALLCHAVLGAPPAQRRFHP